MNELELFNVLESILVNDINVQISLNMDTALLGNQILDSLDFMNYITIIEEKYSISISDEDITKYKLGIIQNMITYLKDRV